MSAPDSNAGAGIGAATIRAAARPDLPRLWELVHELGAYERIEHEITGSAERLGEHLFGASPSAGCVVAERPTDPGIQTGTRIVGYALFYPTFSSFSTVPNLWLEDLYVESTERGRGTGFALMRAVARAALASGCRRMGWAVLDWNRPSIEFYERLGARRSEAGWLQYGLDPEALRRVAGEAGLSPGKGRKEDTSSNT